MNLKSPPLTNLNDIIESCFIHYTWAPSEAAAAEKAAEEQEAASEKAKPASNSSVRQASTNRGARRVQKPNYQEESSTGRAISFVFDCSVESAIY